ncbi:MAG: class I SAM-dependent methyltransferase, partial [Deltaproteobacteria bacterium]|nr:class I SAM-dependent methyltransferase [Deltaproteobacteria bacterium]
MELTEVKFWDDYWKGCGLPSAIDEGFSFDRCLAKELRRHLTGLSGKALEVGCAPGRWMAFLHELGLVPSGIEYSRAGVDITVRNLNMLHVKYG